MTIRSIPILLLCLVSFSCDKAKNLANQAKSAVENEISGKSSNSAGSTPDPELQKSVDQTAEGVLFRKDLPFPNHLEVRTTLRQEMAGRFYQSSAIETRAAEMKGTRIVITKLERAGDQVRFTLEQSSFSLPVVEGEEAPKQAATNPLEQVAPSNKPVTYQKSGKSWRSPQSDGFRAAAVSKLISPVFDQLLLENALAPRSLWFGKRRFKPGDQITVTGNTLPMLLTGNAKGSFTLAYENAEAVEGHPCGVFSVKGDFSRKQFPDFEGEFTDEEVTIESGRIWLSLLHPIILRQELQTIQSTKSGGQGGSSIRGQGKMKISLTREWKAKP